MTATTCGCGCVSDPVEADERTVPEASLGVLRFVPLILKPADTKPITSS